MKKTIALICLFLACLMQAQAQRVQWSGPLHATGFDVATLVGENEGGLFVLRKGWRQPDRNVQLEHYTSDLRLFDKRVVAERRNEHFISTLLYPAGLQLFYTVYNKENKSTELRVKRLSFNLADKGRDTVLQRLSGNTFEQYHLQVFAQPGGMEALLAYREQHGDTAMLRCTLLDSGLNTLGTSLLPVYTDGNEQSIEQAACIGSHIALLLKESLKKKTAGQDYRLRLADGKAGDELTYTPLYADTALVSEGKLKADTRNQAMVFAGYYRYKDSTRLRGYCFWKRDLKNLQALNRMAPFSKAFIADATGKTGTKGITDLRAANIILRGDGGAILSGEQYTESREGVPDMGSYGTTQGNIKYYFAYRNLLVLSLNPQGSEEWHSVIHKEQLTVNDNGLYSSYVMAVTADKLVYIFNDMSRQSWSISLAEVDAHGVVKTDILLPAQDYDGKLIPQFGGQVSYNSIVIPGSNQHGDILMKVTY